MTTRPDEPTRCANPQCECETTELTCSPGCGLLDARRSARCRCDHDACMRHRARVAPPAADTDLYPPVLDRFRHDRRVASRG